MIAKELRDRIVADVSGDLSPSESEQLLYELLQLPEARQLHHALQRDRHSIQNLHRLSADSDLSTRVLAVLAEQSPIIRLPKTRSTRYSRWPQVVGLALGLALAFATTWVVSERNRPSVADSGNKDGAQIVVVPLPPNENKADIDPPKMPNDVVHEPKEPDTNPPTPSRDKPAVKSSSDVLTAPSLPRLSPIEVVKPRMSLPMVSEDFASDSNREVFKKELARDSDHRIELFSQDTAKLADDLMRQSKSKSRSLVTEQYANDAVRRKLKMGYAAYIESYSAAEFENLIRALAREGRFDTLVLIPVADGDRRELRQLLGRDPLESPSESGTKSDMKRRPTDGSPAGGYMSIFPAPKLAGLTKDQTNFWNRRPDRSPGKLRLYLILRPL